MRVWRGRRERPSMAEAFGDLVRERDALRLRAVTLEEQVKMWREDAETVRAQLAERAPAFSPSAVGVLRDAFEAGWDVCQELRSAHHERPDPEYFADWLAGYRPGD